MRLRRRADLEEDGATRRDGVSTASDLRHTKTKRSAKYNYISQNKSSKEEKNETNLLVVRERGHIVGFAGGVIHIPSGCKSTRNLRFKPLHNSQHVKGFSASSA